MVYEDQYKTKEKMLQGIAKATLHIIDGLDWNLNLSYQNEQYIYSNYNTTQSQLPKKPILIPLISLTHDVS